MTSCSRATFSTLLLAAIVSLALFASHAGAETIGSVSPPITGSGNGCGNCNMFQSATTIGQPSYAFPADGIITSFSTSVGTVKPTDSIKFTLVKHIASNSYAVQYVSPKFSIPAASAHSVVTFPVHATAAAGWMIGMYLTTSDTPPTYPLVPFIAGNHTSGFAPFPSIGVNTTIASTFDGYLINASAAFEADADHDGYGDTTEDCYPTDPARHGGCIDETAPVISSLKSKNAKFRVSTKGAIVARKVAKGTTISFTSSEAATVRFSVSRVVKSKTSKKTTLKLVQTFTRNAAGGKNAFAYSGRYRDSKGKKHALKPSVYKLIATPVDAAGNVGTPQSKHFTIID